ncbi:hypothetical protein OV450_3407 [Actinobacteria bacterium OV450]|nr:hypothetical protein OV450_3407 [Actinobacteria bacterium OV450]
MARPRKKLVTTDLAAIYILRIQKPNEHQLFREDDLQRAKYRIYNAARDGKIKRHGGRTKGLALWDLVELHRVFAPREK